MQRPQSKYLSLYLYYPICDEYFPERNGAIKEMYIIGIEMEELFYESGREQIFVLHKN